MQTTSSETSARLSTGSSQLALAAWLGLAALFIAANFASQATGEADTDVFYDYLFAANAVVLYAVLVGITFLIARLLGRPIAALGLGSFSSRWLWTAIGLILGLLVLGGILEPLLHAGEKQGFAPERWEPEHAGAFALNAVVASTFVPFAEELFFRGLGVRALLPLGSGAAIGVSALAFGLGHGIVVALPVLVPFGLALGWVRLRSGSVWPGMLAHGFYNGIGLLYIYFSLT
jgi:membrane protease YdiL (CAAX protease family)